MVDVIQNNESVCFFVSQIKVCGKVVEHIGEDSYMVEVDNVGETNPHISIGDIVLVDGSELIR